jgi:hypothetical protein
MGFYRYWGACLIPLWPFLTQSKEAHFTVKNPRKQTSKFLFLIKFHI